MEISFSPRKIEITYIKLNYSNYQLTEHPRTKNSSSRRFHFFDEICSYRWHCTRTVLKTLSQTTQLLQNSKLYS